MLSAPEIAKQSQCDHNISMPHKCMSLDCLFFGICYDDSSWMRLFLQPRYELSTRELFIRQKEWKLSIFNKYQSILLHQLFEMNIHCVNSHDVNHCQLNRTAISLRVRMELKSNRPWAIWFEAIFAAIAPIPGCLPSISGKFVPNVEAVPFHRSSEHSPKFIF